MYKLEILPADGGEDSILFARDMANVLAKQLGSQIKFNGTSIILDCI